MAVVDHRLPADAVAAARQRNRQILPHHDRVCITNIVGSLNFKEGDKVGEHLRRYVVEAVLRHHRVHGAAVGNSVAVSADAGEGDLDRLIRGDGAAAIGAEEVVGAENGAEVLDGEEGLDGGEGGAVGGDVVDHGLAGGAGGAAGEGFRDGGVWRRNGDDEEE